MAINLRPTLVIGVGGTGGEIAQKVYLTGQQLGLVEKRQLRVLYLDTDDHDQERSTVKETNKVRFSTALRISDLIKRNPDVSAQGGWFYRPDELSARVLNMSLMDGAGQVRMFTRLALQDAFVHGAIENDLRSSIMWLTQISNLNSYKGQINVLIVGSLAGGTGCGSFLQIALAVKEIAQLVSIKKTEVRGLFLLPDVYVNTKLARDQIANVLANGYAALRELNAVMQSTEGHIDIDSLRFEYMPGKILKKGQMPFEAVTLIDYEMTGGGSLGPNLDHYKELMARIAHTQLFLPLGQEADQRSVNSVQLALAGVKLGTSNSYASVGSFSIIYPQDAILAHLTARFSAEVLEGDWLALDRSYRRRVEAYEERRRTGDHSLRVPDRGESFISDLDQFARDRRPLFTGIYKNVFKEEKLLKGGAELRISFETFRKAFEDYILAQFRNENEQIREAFAAARRSVTQFTVHGDIPDQVRIAERNLNRIWEVYQDAVRHVPDSIYDNFWAGGLSMTDSEWGDHHLQKHLVAPSPHLVEVRYFLYSLIREINKRMDELKPENFYGSVVGASHMLENKEYKRQTASSTRAGPGPQAKADAIAEEGFFKRHLFSKRKEFVNPYVKYYNSSLDNMRGFAEHSTLKRCLERLKSDAEGLIRLLELLFSDLEALQGELIGWLNEDKSRHSATAGAQSGTRYVYASEEAKNEIWESIKPEVLGSNIAEEANSQLVRALFSEVKKRKKGYTSRGTTPQDVFSIRGIFKSAVIDGFCGKRLSEDLREHYVFDAGAALRREADLYKRDYEHFATELIQISEVQASPFIQLNNERTGSDLVYWAMHPDTLKSLGGKPFADELFARGENVKYIDEEEYDRTRLLCFHLKHTFSLQNLSKLQPGDRNSRSVFDNIPGRYDSNYRIAIEEVDESDAAGPNSVRFKLSPHLDRNWHKPTFLPEIFPHLDETAADRLYQDFVIAYAAGYLRRDLEIGQRVFVFINPEKLAQGGERSVVLNIKDHDMSEALALLKTRPDIARASRQAFRKDLERSRNEYLQEHGVIQIYDQFSKPELLVDFLKIANNRTMKDVNNETSNTVRAYFQVLQTILVEVKQDTDRRRLREDVKTEFRALADRALDILKKQKILQDDTLKEVEHMPATIAEAVLQEWV